MARAKAARPRLGPGSSILTTSPVEAYTLIPATMPAEEVASFGEESPMGRPGQPVEVAAPFVWLAPDEVSSITGERSGVTGGTPLP